MRYKITSNDPDTGEPYRVNNFKNKDEVIAFLLMMHGDGLEYEVIG